MTDTTDMTYTTDTTHAADEQLQRYTRAARRASARVITTYSTSFGLASRVLGRSTRQAIADIYALVRVADEIVDGTAAAAGFNRPAQARALDFYQHETERALATGFSTDLIVHAFAVTARQAGFSHELTRPFFRSMRRDLDPTPLRASEVQDYIYGSAEVVGLMCLQVFLADRTVSEPDRETMTSGARHLGSAFQKVNFLRDLSADVVGLQRNYFPWIQPERLTAEQRDEILQDIAEDIRRARAAVPILPLSARAAVLAATDLFDALARKVAATDPQRLLTARISVNNLHKLWIVVRSVVVAPFAKRKQNDG